jgi:hypothetical protein
MVEMKEYRKVADHVIADLVKRNKIGENDLSKGVMDTGSGIRVWQSLRVVSDAALYDRLARDSAVISKGIPTFDFF